MHVDVLVAEIGSTTTMVSAFDGIEDRSRPPSFLGQGQATTSVDQGDVLIGLKDSIENLKEKLGADDLTYNELLAPPVQLGA